MDYLNHLNDEQYKAVTYLDGPQLIIAGAGSGKTRVLTYKIVHLIKQGYRPDNILALTFTNKAAREMKERMSQLISANQLSGLWMGTFHAIFNRILKREAKILGYTSSFAIYDTDDSRKLIKEVVKEFNLDTEQYKPQAIHSYISLLKNNLILPDAYLSNDDFQKRDAEMKRPYTGHIYKRYQERLKKADAMDFDDLLLNMNILFRDHKDILEKYRQRFHYILVDEYQDTNYSQYLILKKLAGEHHKLSVVGDDAQSIYAFRGARIENIHNLEKDFPDLKIFKLQRNYRSTQHIVKAANSLIEKNKKQIKKTIYTENAEGEKIKIIAKNTGKSEAYFVAKEIVNHVRTEKIKYSDIAILYRMNAQSRLFESTLREYAVPYRIFGGKSFYQRKEIKDVIAYLRVIINRNDEQAIRRIINYPRRGIGDKTIEKIVQLANSQNVTFWEVLENIQDLSKYFGKLASDKLLSFRNLIKSFDDFDMKKEVVELVEAVVKRSGIKQELLEDRSQEGEQRYLNVQEFINAVYEYFRPKEDEDKIETEDRTLQTFLNEIALITDLDESDDEDNKVNLMTIHASKGLEFDVVFIVGMEDGIFPGTRSFANPKDLEEERRLMYVAMTRARKFLYLTYAKERFLGGRTMYNPPSRFLKDISDKYLDRNDFEEFTQDNFEKAKENYTFATSKKTTERKLKPAGSLNTGQTKDFDKESGLRVGMLVEHSKFGRGKVLQIQGDYPDTRALVDFEVNGKKNLILKFAKLKKISN